MNTAMLEQETKGNEAAAVNGNAVDAVVNGTAELNRIAGLAGKSEPEDVRFKIGWSYDIFLRKNNLAPSETAQAEWLERSREASKAQVALISQLTGAGLKTKCGRKAVYNKRDGRWDTALTARVVQPGCKDQDLILDAVVKAQARAAKSLSDMRAAAMHAGVLITGNNG